MEQRLASSLRIVEKGPELGCFDVFPIVKLWCERKIHRSNQSIRKK